MGHEGGQLGISDGKKHSLILTGWGGVEGRGENADNCN